ncbi:MAG: CRISPR-associated CARF protein Csx1 [Bacillota bacterium]
MSSLIYQIGRFDRGLTKEYDFEKDGKSIKKRLSSFALKELLEEEGEDSRVVLIYPVSLPLNRGVDKEELKNNSIEIERLWENPSEYLNNPREFFSRLPFYREADDFFIIHSIGTYSGVTFEGEFSDIVFEIAMDMIERYLKNPVEKIYVDVSTGFNIYVSALLEAVRLFSTWAALRSWLPEEGRPEIWLSFSDPILGGGATKYPLHLERVSFKSFFSSPLSKNDVTGERFYKEVYRGDKEKRARLKKLFENFAVVFTAINRNAPLAVYHLGFDDANIIRETFEVLLDDMKNLLYESYLKSPGLNRGAYQKAILTLGFYEGIVKVLDKYGVKVYESEIGSDLEEIKNTFGEIYELFGLDLNRVFLGNEIGSTWIKIKSKAEDCSNWQPFALIHGSGQRIGPPNKRNYFAHSGLEAYITQFRKESNRIFVRYTEKYWVSSGDEKDTSELLKKWFKEELY